MLYINNLKNIAKKKRIPINELADLIGISGNGLHLALKNDTLKVRDLQKIAEILGVDIREFFTEEEKPELNYSNINFQKGQNNINDQKINYGNKNETELLKIENNHLKETIQLQKQLIEALKK